MPGKTHTIISMALIAMGFVFVYFLSSYVETHRVNLPEAYEDEDLTLEGKRLKGFVMGADGLVADWYWMRSLQYIGGKIVKQDLNNINLDDLTSLNPRLLYPMLDISTELDPHFVAPFSYGATVLPAIDAQKAIALTEKGIAANPNEWRLLQWLGYIHWKLGDYEKAAQVYERGDKVPGAPPFFKLMAGRMRGESGSRDTAREIYKQMLAEAPDQKTKYAAEIRILELDSLDERDAIAHALADYQRTRGRCAASLRELTPQLQHVELPHGNHFEVTQSGDLADPTGTPYLFDRAQCTVGIDYAHSKIPAK
jgi:tetratricopeptide (TPR) repeat protein